MRKFETCEVWGMDFEPSHASLWCGVRALHAIVQGSGFLFSRRCFCKSALRLGWMPTSLWPGPARMRSGTKAAKAFARQAFQGHPGGPVLDFRE